MDNEKILTLLKIDLEISTTSRDEYLNNVIDLAKASIEREGITLEESIEDEMLVACYSAFLYRKRKSENYSMPRQLRYMLNNRLLSEKARAD